MHDIYESSMEVLERALPCIVARERGVKKSIGGRMLD